MIGPRAQLERQVDQLVDLARASASHPEQGRVLREGILAWLDEALDRHGYPGDAQTRQRILKADVELNAQGLLVWLERAARAAGLDHDPEFIGSAASNLIGALTGSRGGGREDAVSTAGRALGVDRHREVLAGTVDVSSPVVSSATTIVPCAAAAASTRSRVAGDIEAPVGLWKSGMR